MLLEASLQDDVQRVLRETVKDHHVLIVLEATGAKVVLRDTQGGLVEEALLNLRLGIAVPSYRMELSQQVRVFFFLEVRNIVFVDHFSLSL
jgi:hypothetical protein